MMTVKFSILASAVLLLTACSSSTADKYQQQQTEALEDKSDQMEQTLNDIPDWFLTPPTSNDLGVYATSSARSEDLQYARELALFQAEYAIAKTINNELSGQERLFRTDGAGVFKSTSDQTVVKKVANSNVLGYRIVVQEYRIENGVYAAYVLLHMPYETQQMMIESQSIQKKAEERYEKVEHFGSTSQ